MKAPWMITLGLLWAASLVVLSADSDTYPLKPVALERADAEAGHHLVDLGKDGQGEMPFTTASGKLHFKMSGDRMLLDWGNDGKFVEALRDEDGHLGAKIPVKLGGKAFEYPVQWYRLMRSPTDERGEVVYVVGKAYVEAQVGRTVVRLYDTNLNGHFGDPGDMIQIGAEAGPRPFTKYAAIEGKIQELQIVNDGEGLKLSPYGGPAATVKLNNKEGWSTQLQLVHADGLFVASPSSTAVLLVPGAYRPQLAQARFGEKAVVNGRDEYPIEFYGSGSQSATIQIKEGQNTLAFGPPFRLEFTAGRTIGNAAEVAITDVVLTGGAGEQYRANNYGSNRGNSLTCSVRSAGKEQEVAKLSYG